MLDGHTPQTGNSPEAELAVRTLEASMARVRFPSERKCSAFTRLRDRSATGLRSLLMLAEAAAALNDVRSELFLNAANSIANQAQKPADRQKRFSRVATGEAKVGKAAKRLRSS